MKKIKYILNPLGLGYKIEVSDIGMSKRKRDVLSRYKIKDLMSPKWWEFWKDKNLAKLEKESITLFCRGADILDNGDWLLTLQHRRADGAWYSVVSKKAYCEDCKMLVSPNWTGGVLPESYSAECPHCGFLFAEN